MTTRVSAMRRTLSVISAAVLLASTMAWTTAPPTFAANPVPLSLGQACDNGTPKYNGISYIVRTGSFDAVKSDWTVVRNVAPCVGPNSNWSALSLVNAANIQTTTGQTVQLGYGQCRTSPVLSCGSFPNLTMSFWWTAQSNMVVNPATWAPPLVVSHAYFFTITAVTHNSSPMWQYTITDRANGASGTGWSPRSGTGNTVWWGYEVWNNNSQKGYLSGDGTINMSGMSYSTTSSGGWEPYLTGSQTINNSAALPSWHHCVVGTNGSYGANLNCYSTY